MEEREPYVVSVHEPDDQGGHFLLQIFARPISFHRPFVSLTGAVTSALMLSQALYWMPRATLPGSWFYKTAQEWEEETGLTPREQETARKRLRQFPWWQEELRKANGAPTVHYRVDINGFQQSLQSHFAHLSKSNSTNARNPGISTNARKPIKDTETTTETTYTITNNNEKSPSQEPESTTAEVDWQRITDYWRVVVTGKPMTIAQEEWLWELYVAYKGTLLHEALVEAVRNNSRGGLPTHNFVRAICERMRKANEQSEQRRLAISGETASSTPQYSDPTLDKLREEMLNGRHGSGAGSGAETL